MTAFEPEALGNLLEGMEFHKFYFDHGMSIPFCSQVFFKFKISKFTIHKVEYRIRFDSFR